MKRPEAYDALRAEVAEYRSAWGAPSPEQLSEIAIRDLPSAGRSAFAGAAREAIRNHPGDPSRADAELRDAEVSQYAELTLTGSQRQAVTGVLAASAEAIAQAFGQHWKRFEWPDGAPPAWWRGGPR